MDGDRPADKEELQDADIWATSLWADATSSREGTDDWDSTGSRRGKGAASQREQQPRAVGDGRGHRADNAGRWRPDGDWGMWRATSLYPPESSSGLRNSRTRIKGRGKWHHWWALAAEERRPKEVAGEAP